MQLHRNYICTFIHIFDNHIMASAVLCVCMLYSIIVGCTSSRNYFQMSSLCMGYSCT